MIGFSNNVFELNEKGFSISSTIFNSQEIEHISELINTFIDNDSHQKYAIRNLFINLPDLSDYIFNLNSFKTFLNAILSQDYFLTKSIYFNKPSMSNWFVPYHQDLSISAKNKKEIKGFSNWTKKDNVYGVQPPKDILENTITMRIHLDDTNITNGALRVIEKSHLHDVIRIDDKFNASKIGEEKICNVLKGSIMLMKPLTLHASDKSISKTNRRVIHLEFCNKHIPEEIDWFERKNLN